MHGLHRCRTDRLGCEFRDVLWYDLITMEQIHFWEGHSVTHSDNHEIFSLLWNQKIHCVVHETSPLRLVLNQLNFVYIFKALVFNISINVILTPTPKPPKWPFSSVFPTVMYKYLTFHSCYMPAHLITKTNRLMLFKEVNIFKVRITQNVYIQIKM